MIPPAITSTRMTSIFNTGHLLLKPEIKAWAKNRNFFHRRIGQKDICKSLCPFVIHPPVVYSCSKGRKRSVEIRVCVCVSDTVALWFARLTLEGMNGVLLVDGKNR